MVPIYFDELAEVLKACTRLRPDECSSVQLRQLMADHLTTINPELANKVLAFDSPQLFAPIAFVLQAQALVGMSDRTGTMVGQGA
jgi:TorA maturation chaperone TorD